MPFNYPTLPDSTASRDFQDSFGGYNHNLRIADNEFYDMKNMTGDYFPVLSPRKKRGIIQTNYTNLQTMLSKDALCVIDGNHFYLNGNEVQDFAATHSVPSESDHFVMVEMGAYVLVFEKTVHGLDNGWYINTLDVSDHGLIDKVNTLTPRDNQVLRLRMCGKDGEDYLFSSDPGVNVTGKECVYIGDDPPSNPQNGKKWIDTSGSTHYLKVYASNTSMWSTVLTTYVKLSCPRIAEDFKEGDAVDIRGLNLDDPHSGNSYSDKLKEQVKFLNANAIIQSRDKEGDSWIVIIGMIDGVCNQGTDTVTISRVAPLMDYICECNNRLWGCRYGPNRAGDTVNEIYACKQGDFKNWSCYAGISTDSYAASVGSDGVWTGAVHFGKEVLFMKENCMHKLYGSMPSNYQLLELKHRGLQRGSEKSLVCVNETLFYKTTSEIVYYDGSLPVSISNPLGERMFYDAAAGSVGNKYYISMRDDNNEWGLYVYDITKQTWHKEDSLHVTSFCRDGNRLYALADNNALLDLTEADNNPTFTTVTEPDFEWYAQTGKIGYSYSDNKYVGRILVRLQKPLTSEIRLLVRYDDGAWETVAELTGGGTRSYSLPVLPRRCDHFELRIEGKGDCKLYSISKVLDIGSDVS